MNLENVKLRYVEVGLPLMLTGVILFAIGYILDYITMSIYDISYIQIRFLVLLGMLFIVIGGGSILCIIGDK